MKNKSFRYTYYLPVILLALSALLITTPAKEVKAEGALVVSLGVIDYEDLTIQIFNNDNSIVYYSEDEENWTEVEGAYNSTTKSFSMDLSWVSVKNDVTLYFKGNIVTTIISVTLPGQDLEFNVTYDKAEGEFAFEISDNAEFFEWRKTSDYNWYRVNLDYETASYKAFMNTMEEFRVKGAKIIIRIPQKNGNVANTGCRPSKEILITIVPRSEAPTVSVNSSKLTVNTTPSMEYYVAKAYSWFECERAMPFDVIVPEVLYENGSHDVTLMIRTAATTAAPYSKTAFITVKGQAAPPQIGDNTKDVTYYYINSKLVISFNKASLTSVYEYTVVKVDSSFDITTARWTSVKNSNLITLSTMAAPEGCTVYFRKKGTDAGPNTALVLSSAIKSFDVAY